MIEWQTIETAPKDGTAIRLKKGDWEASGQWHVNGWCGLSRFVYIKPAFNEAHQPTHWREIVQSDIDRDNQEYWAERAKALSAMKNSTVFLKNIDAEYDKSFKKE